MSDLKIRMRYAMRHVCRLFGHQWARFDTSDAPKLRFFVLRGWGVYRCNRCHVVRWDNPESARIRRALGTWPGPERICEGCDGTGGPSRSCAGCGGTGVFPR